MALSSDAELRRVTAASELQLEGQGLRGGGPPRPSRRRGARSLGRGRECRSRRTRARPPGPAAPPPARRRRSRGTIGGRPGGRRVECPERPPAGSISHRVPGLHRRPSGRELTGRARSPTANPHAVENRAPDWTSNPANRTGSRWLHPHGLYSGNRKGPAPANAAGNQPRYFGCMLIHYRPRSVRQRQRRIHWRKIRGRDSRATRRRGPSASADARRSRHPSCVVTGAFAGVGPLAGQDSTRRRAPWRAPRVTCRRTAAAPIGPPRSRAAARFFFVRTSCFRVFRPGTVAGAGRNAVRPAGGITGRDQFVAAPYERCGAAAVRDGEKPRPPRDADACKGKAAAGSSSANPNCSTVMIRRWALAPIAARFGRRGRGSSPRGQARSRGAGITPGFASLDSTDNGCPSRAGGRKKSSGRTAQVIRGPER